MNVDIIFFISYAIFAFIALFINPLFYSFHLIELIIRYPIMINIMKSFWKPRVAMFLTLILIFMTNYFFSIIGFIKFSKYYASSENNVSSC